MKKILMIMSILILSAFDLHADLTVNIPFDRDVTGPAYNDSTYTYTSEYFDVINNGTTDDFTLLVDYTEMPSGWSMIWCHEYQGGGACHLPTWPWEFEFGSGDTLKLDFSITVSSFGSIDFYYKFTAATLADSVVLDFSYTTGASVDDPQTDESARVRNFPNPFSESTTISFARSLNPLKLDNIIIYNIKGEMVKSFNITPDMNSITWDGTDENGEVVPSGVYLYTISLDDEITKTEKLLLLR